MNNKLLDIQEMLLKSMKRLDKEQSLEELTTEISRGNALSNNAMTILKSISTNLRVIETANKNGIAVKKLNAELGVDNEE